MTPTIPLTPPEKPPSYTMPKFSRWKCPCGFEGAWQDMMHHRQRRNRKPSCEGSPEPADAEALAARQQWEADGDAYRVSRNLEPRFGWVPVGYYDKAPDPPPPPAGRRSRRGKTAPAEEAEAEAGEEVEEGEPPEDEEEPDEEAIARRLYEARLSAAGIQPWGMSGAGAGGGGSIDLPVGWGLGGDDLPPGFSVQEPPESEVGPSKAGLSVQVPVAVHVMYDWARLHGWRAGDGGFGAFVIDCLLDYFETCWRKRLVIVDLDEYEEGRLAQGDDTQNLPPGAWPTPIQGQWVAVADREDD